MNGNTQPRGGSWLALAAAAASLIGTIAASAVHSTAGWADTLLAGPVVISAILFAATAWVARARPAAATVRSGLTYFVIAVAASVALAGVFAWTSLDARLLLYVLPLGAAMQLAQLGRSLSEERVRRTVSG